MKKLEKIHALFFCFAVERGLGVKVHPNQMAACHRLGKKKLIGEFLWRGKGSHFERVLFASKKFKKSNVKASLQLLGQDKHLANVAQGLKKNKVINSWFVDFTSGKLTVCQNGQRYIISKEADFEKVPKHY